MKVSASFARDLVDRRGADVRTIVLDNLHPIGRAGHTAKTTHRWAVTRAADGTTTWTHTTTGFTITHPPPRPG